LPIGIVETRMGKSGGLSEGYLRSSPQMFARNVHAQNATVRIAA